MSKMNECDCGQAKYRGLNVCEECYAKMFEGIEPPMPEPVQNEDFFIEHEVANIMEVEPTIYKDEDMPSEYLVASIKGIDFPKTYKIDFENNFIREYEIGLLLRAVLSEIYFSETHPMFDEIKYLLKEVK